MRALCRASAAALLLCGAPSLAVGTAARGPTPRETVRPTPASPSPSNLREDVTALRDDIGALWHQIDRLTDGAEAPRWADAENQRLHRRLERLTAMLERLSARVDTPVPRLDDPLTLLAVSLSSLLLGFFAGRGLQRRSGRKDSRFRL